MMSMKCKYAIKALVRLAKYYEKGYVQTAEIAAKENIPKKFLEQILLGLKHARLVNSRPGVGGGYYMVKDPAAISVADVHRIFDGAIAPVPCVSLNFYKKCGDCQDEETCIFRGEFIKIREGARVVMSKTSIASFLKAPGHRGKPKTSA